MSTPELYLQTGYILDSRGRLIATREPRPERAPIFAIAWNTTRCVWAVRADVPDAVAVEFERFAVQESQPHERRAAPQHVNRYRYLAQECTDEGSSTTVLREVSGPAFTFPAVLPPPPPDLVRVEDEALLESHFRGWVPGEIASGRAPVLAILEEGSVVSTCFCARRSEYAAEAGLETAQAFRGRGLAGQVAAAWALAVRSEGLTPLYSTAWANHASRAVAAKLGLEMYACTWSISE